MDATYSPFIVVRATYADDSYWTTDTSAFPERAKLRSFSPMSIDDVPAAVKDRLREIISAIDKAHAETQPVKCIASGFIRAAYPDGRECDRHLFIGSKTMDQLSEEVQTWTLTALKELRATGDDDA